MSCLVADLAAEDTPQVYIACGRGPQSSLRVLRHGLEVSIHVVCHCGCWLQRVGGASLL